MFLFKDIYKKKGKKMADLLKNYLERANEIIGDRTKEEEIYDQEVLR
jgi:hypothetical protein